MNIIFVKITIHKKLNNLVKFKLFFFIKKAINNYKSKNKCIKIILKIFIVKIYKLLRKK